MSVRRWARQFLAALNPGLEGSLADFRSARSAVARAPGGRRVVAVIGLSEGEGRSSVTALTALVAAAHTDRRVAVIDTVRADRAAAVRPPAAVLLGGRVDHGRLDVLLAGPDGEPVARTRVTQAATPGAAVPVLALPPGTGGFPPQLLEQTLDRLTDRADLVLVDTPAGAHAPVLHAVLASVDHLLLVVRADRDVARRVRALVDWIDRAPGMSRDRELTVVLVQHGWRRHRWRPDLPFVVVHRSAALRRGRLGALSRRSVTEGLRIVATVERY